MRYRAKIIGFKKSKRRPGQYHPIFEYVNCYGETRRYIRQKGMEKTPFTESRTYKICKGDFTTYEKTEKKLAMRIYICIAYLLLMMSALIIPRSAHWMIVVGLLIFAACVLIKALRQHKLKRLCNKMEQVDGIIIGYRKTQRNKLFGIPDIAYRPLIEYKYGKEYYIHIGKIACSESQMMEGSICRIYVHAKKQLVVDEFEINAPLLNIPSWYDKSIRTTCAEITQRARELPKQIIKAPKRRILDKEMRVVGTPPLRTYDYKNVANWY